MWRAQLTLLLVLWLLHAAGCIPEELGMFPKMRFFDLSSNALSGDIIVLIQLYLLLDFFTNLINC